MTVFHAGVQIPSPDLRSSDVVHVYPCPYKENNNNNNRKLITSLIDLKWVWSPVDGSQCLWAMDPTENQELKQMHPSLANG